MGGDEWLVGPGQPWEDVVPEPLTAGPLGVGRLSGLLGSMGG